MKKQVFRGAGVAIVTPMYPDGSICYEKLAALIEEQIVKGTDAIVICGTTGEASTLTDQEHVDCIAFAVKCAKGRVPVVAGTGSNDTAYAVQLSKEAEHVGADALLQVTPYYNKTSQRGLIAHFTAIADATDLPVILYNVPSRTGMGITLPTYQVLAQHEKIVATKEASGNLSQIAELAAACGEDLAIYSGNDDQILPILSLGGIGVISVLSNVMPKETHDMCSLYFEGKVAESTALQLSMMPLVKALFSDVNPIPVKEALNLMGYGVGECRLPLIGMEEGARENLRRVLQSYGRC